MKRGQALKKPQMPSSHQPIKERLILALQILAT
jgi:hypothetical protein